MKASPSPALTKKSNILVVEDHPLMRHALIGLINREPDLVCGGEANTVPCAVDAVAQVRPDAVVLDLMLKGGDGLALIQSLRKQQPRLPILVISSFDEDLYAERALRAGASGYVMKEAAAEEVIVALRTVLAGKRYVSRSVALRAFEQSLESKSQTPKSGVEGLSNRELHVFQLLGASLSTREIAARLNLSIKTIETYRENLKHKLRLQNAEELIRRATDWVEGRGSPD